jgi:hypothetical protein
MRAPIATAVAIAIAVLVLIGYFVSVPLITDVQALLLGWAVIVAGFAALVGIVNLIIVHWRRATAPQNRDMYSVLVIAAFLLTFAVGVWYGPADPAFQQVINAFQVPAEASLMAVLAVTLTVAGLRLLQRRKGVLAVVFMLSALVYLVLASGLFVSGDWGSPVKELLHLINRLPLAGARGILLGIALGSLTAGLRVILGADRPYSG